MPLGLGVPELIIILVILLVVFGPKRLPGIGKSLGSGIREFKDSIGGDSSDRDDDDEERGPRRLDPAPADARVTRVEERDRVPEPRG